MIFSNWFKRKKVKDTFGTYVEEMQKTHDLKDVVELLNDLYDNLEKGDSLMTTVVQLEPTETSKVKFEGDIKASMVVVGLLANVGTVVPYKKITSSNNLEYITGLIFDLDCYGHFLLKANLYANPDASGKQLILVVK